MKIPIIDNSLKDLGKVVLWQYDKAVRLLSLLKHIEVMFYCSVEQFWDFWREKVLAIDTCGSFGCSIWGLLLGVPRPNIVDSGGRKRPIAPEAYRKLLKGAFFLMKSSSSYQDIISYLEIVFGISSKDSLSKWKDHISETGWTTNIDELNGGYQVGQYYAAGDIVWYHEGDDDEGSNWKFTRDVTAAENVSWASTANARISTTEPINVIKEDSTILFKLYNPDGECMAINGANSGALNLRVSVLYGDVEVVATAQRWEKCGVSIVDNQDMSMTYVKTEYYDEMHPDQKYLYEQHFEEFCPYPIGIKSNVPVPEWVFGLQGQQNARYAITTAYAEGDVFGYVDPVSHDAYNYRCKEAIPAASNLNFESIRDKLEIVGYGDPFVGTLVNAKFPYADPIYGNSKLSHRQSSMFGSDADIIRARAKSVLMGTTDQAKMIREKFLGEILSIMDIESINYFIDITLYSDTLYLIEEYETLFCVKVTPPKEHIIVVDDVVALVGDTYLDAGRTVTKILITSVEILKYPTNNQILPFITTPSTIRFPNFYKYLEKKDLSKAAQSAVSKIATYCGWEKIRYSISTNQILGVRYPKNAILMQNGESNYFIWDDTALAVDPFWAKGHLNTLGKTTIISESTLQRLQQENN